MPEHLTPDQATQALDTLYQRYPNAFGKPNWNEIFNRMAFYADMLTLDEKQWNQRYFDELSKRKSPSAKKVFSTELTILRNAYKVMPEWWDIVLVTLDEKGRPDSLRRHMSAY